jgi:hypothetical protein
MTFLSLLLGRQASSAFLPLSFCRSPRAALRNHARPQLMPRSYDTKCPIKSQLLHRTFAASCPEADLFRSLSGALIRLRS